MDNFPALSVGVTCVTSDSSGNANPFCPQTPAGSPATIPPPIGFQFVPALSGTRCTSSIPRRTTPRNVTQPWMSQFSSPAVAEVERFTGQTDIAGSTDPYQLTVFASLASDVSVLANDLWTSAGTYLTSLGGTPATQFTYSPTAEYSKLAASNSANAAARAAQPGRIRTDLLATLGLPDDEYHTAAAAAAAQPNRSVDLASIPLCPFPDVQYSASLSASPPTAGLGYLVTLPPYFNCS